MHVKIELILACVLVSGTLIDHEAARRSPHGCQKDCEIVLTRVATLSDKDRPGLFQDARAR